MLGMAGQNNPCTTNILCECNNANSTPVGAGAATAATCSDAAEDVNILINCSNPEKPTGSFTGVPTEGPNGEPVQVRVCTTFEFVDGYGISFQLPGLLPQHASGEQLDFVSEHLGTWRITIVVSWCVDGGWCCKKASCEFEVTQVTNTTDPCAGGSGCSFDPGDLKGLPEACPLLGGDATQQNPTLVVPGQAFNLWFEGGMEVVDYESLCAQQNMDNPDFPGEFIHNVTTTGPIETFVTDSCSWQRNMFRVVETAQADANITITIELGYSLCAMYTITLHLRVSPDGDQDMLLDCIEGMDDQCPWINNPDSDGDGMLDGEEVMLSQLHLDAGECRPVEYLFDSVYDGPCGGIPAFEFDHDRDGVSTVYEMVFSRTHPLGFDTDRDGAQDLAELELLVELPSEADLDGRKLNPRVADGAGSHPVIVWHDADRDNLYDSYEMSRGWDTTSSDQDGDGIRDGLEMIYPALNGPESADQGPVFPGVQVDTDRDGLSDHVEDRMGTNKNRADTDRDGISDGAEAAMGSDPRSNDSDNNGTRDGDEDFDGDGVSNADERIYGLNLMDADTDNDGNCDSSESDTGPNNRRRRNGNLVGSFVGPYNCGQVDPSMCVRVACGNIWPDGSVMRTIYPGGVVEPPCDPNVDVTYTIGASECATFTMTNTCPDVGGPVGTSCTEPQACSAPVVQHRTTTWPTHCHGQTTTTICLTLVEGTPTADLNIDPSDLFPGLFPTNSNDPNDPNDPNHNQWDDPEGWDVFDSNRDGVADQRDSPLAVDLDIDSLNAHGFDAPEQDPDSDRYESDPSKPGKVCLATTFDSDGDNIPDYADGFDLFEDRVPGATTHAQADELKDLDNKSTHTFIPVKVRFRGAISPPPGTGSSSGNYHKQGLTLTYDGSDPHLIQTDLAHLFELPPTGNFRLWAYFYERNTFEPPAPNRSVPGLVADIINGTSMFGSAEDSPQEGSPDCGAHMPDERSLEEDLDGDNDRDADDQMLAAQAGKLVGWRYVFPGQDYEPWRLGAVSWPMNGNEPGEVTMMLEVVSHSPTFAQKITAEVSAPTINGQSTVSDETNCDFDPTKTEDVFAAKDCVTATAVEKQYVYVNENAQLAQRLHYLPISRPTPHLSLFGSGVQVVQVYPDLYEPYRLMADILISVEVDDATCDLTEDDPATAYIDGVIVDLTATINDAQILDDLGEPRRIDLSHVYKNLEPDFDDPLVIRRPYDYHGVANGVLIQQVPIIPGTNVLSLQATNPKNYMGDLFVEFDINVTPPPPQKYEMVLHLYSDTALVDAPTPPGTDALFRFRTYPELNPPQPPPAYTEVTLLRGALQGAFSGGANFQYALNILNPLPLSPNIDDFGGEATIPDAGWNLTNGTVLLKETGGQTRAFESHDTLGPESRPTWDLFTINWSIGRFISASDEPAHLWVEEIKGPPGIVGHVQHVEVGERRYKLFENSEGRVWIGKNYQGEPWPRAFSAVAKIGTEIAPPIFRPGLRHYASRVLNPDVDNDFIREMSEFSFEIAADNEWRSGFWQGTKDFAIDNSVGIAIAISDGVNKINEIGQVYNARFTERDPIVRLLDPDDHVLVEDDRKTLKAMGGAIDKALGHAYIAVKDDIAYNDALQTGNEEELKRLETKYRAVLEDTVLVMEDLAEVINLLPEDKKGEIAAQVQLTVATVPIGAGALHAVALPLRSTRIAAAIEFLRLPKIRKYIPANRRAMYLEKLAALEGKIGHLKTTRRIREVIELIYDFEATGEGYERGWAAWQRAMVRVRQLVNNGKLSKSDACIPFYNAVCDEYKAGRMVTVQQIRNEMGWAPGREAFFADMVMDTHHTVPTNEILIHLVRKKFPNMPEADLKNYVNSIKDTMPGFPLPKADHAGASPSAFHSILRDKCRGIRPNNTTGLIDALEETYSQFATTPGHDSDAILRAWDQANQWITAQGLR